MCFICTAFTTVTITKESSTYDIDKIPKLFKERHCLIRFSLRIHQSIGVATMKPHNRFFYLFAGSYEYSSATFQQSERITNHCLFRNLANHKLFKLISRRTSEDTTDAVTTDVMINSRMCVQRTLITYRGELNHA